MRDVGRSFALLGTLALTACTTFTPGAPEGRVDIVAHRGASAYAPENTLAAFELAAKMNADWFELDCSLSQDGVVVVIHDDTLERTTGVVGRVEQFTFDEMRGLDAGSWFDSKFSDEGIPSLGEALELAKGRIGVYVEIKNSDEDGELAKELLALPQDGERLLPEHRDAAMALVEASGTRNLELTRRVVAEIRERGMERQVVIQSFSAVVCLVSLAEAPEFRTELLASSSVDDPGLWDRFLRWRTLLGPAGFNVNREDLTAELISDCHADGQTVAVWTVNDEAEMRRLIDLDVDALITNYPDTALSIAQVPSDPGQD